MNVQPAGGLLGVPPASSRSSRAFGTAAFVVRHTGGRGLCHAVWVSRDSSGRALARIARREDVIFVGIYPQVAGASDVCQRAGRN